MAPSSQHVRQQQYHDLPPLNQQPSHLLPAPSRNPYTTNETAAPGFLQRLVISCWPWLPWASSTPGDGSEDSAYSTTTVPTAPGWGQVAHARKGSHKAGAFNTVTIHESSGEISNDRYTGHQFGVCPGTTLATIQERGKGMRNPVKRTD